MKTIYKIFAIIMIAVCTMVIMPDNMSFAGSNATGAIDNISTSSSDIEVSGFAGVIGKLLGFLQIASGLAAVIVIAFIGFNYIIATPQMKDELKSKGLPILVGVILVFGATSIAKFFIGIGVVN